MQSEKDILKWPRGLIDFTPGCQVMGILNVTDDSFSDGGKFIDTTTAAEHALAMAGEGAAVIDIGAESTRPGSKPIDPAVQIERIVSTIIALRKKINVPISVDTYSPQVALAALEAGAAMLNDITALADDNMAELAAEYEVPIVLMHMQGTPETMQNEPDYDDVVAEVLAFLLERAARAQSFGVKKSMIFIDPGIGFGKTTEHNLTLLSNIDKFAATGYRVLIGASRKRFIGEITGQQTPVERLFGTVATSVLAAAAGAAMVRVHDVRENLEAIKMTNAIKMRG